MSDTQVLNQNPAATHVAITIEDVNTILNTLAEYPYKEVANAIKGIEQGQLINITSPTEGQSNEPPKEEIDPLSNVTPLSPLAKSNKSKETEE